MTTFCSWPTGRTPMAHRSPALRTALLIAVAALVALPARAQDRVGTTAAPFLTLGAGARGQALGHAYAAEARGGDALFWNPAGASRRVGSTSGNVFLTQHEWIAGIQYNAVGVTIPFGRGGGVVGLSLANVDYGRDEVRTETNPDGTGETFGASDLSFGLTYSRPLTESFYFGGTAKVVRQSIWDMSATGYAVDLGISLDTGFNGVVLAASIQNFGTQMRMSGVNAQEFIDVDETTSGNTESVTAQLEMDSWDMPLSFRFGASAPVVRAGGAELVLMADAQQTNDNLLNADFGGLVRYHIAAFDFELRGGYKDAFVEDVDNHLAFGGGVRAAVGTIAVGVDVAYLPFNLLGNSKLIDLRLDF